MAKKMKIVDVREGESEIDAEKRPPESAEPSAEMPDEEEVVPGLAGLKAMNEALIGSGLMREARASVALDKGDGETHSVGDDCEGGHATPPEPHRLSKKELKERAVPNVVPPPEPRLENLSPALPRWLDVTEIVPSETNPRRTRPDDTELVNSIRRHGILQPILVRPVKTPEGDDIFEVVAGHRRFSAALVSGMPKVPVMISAMTDEEALEAQLTENLHRADIHPLEEAEGFDRLLKEFGVPIEDVIARVGKSRSYVYGRLKLLDLIEPARKAFYKGLLLASVASLLARIPDAKLQAKALTEVLGGEEKNAEPLSFRGAQLHLQTNYMLRLSDAPFDTKDDMLVEGVPACGPCPYRSGNNRDLFGDVDRVDVCTNPTCFSSKVAATWAAKKIAAREKGWDVMSLADSRKLFKTGSLQWDSDWVELGAIVHDDKDKRTWRQILGKEVPQITLAQDPLGHAHELVLREAAESVAGLKSTKKKAEDDEVELTKEEKEIQAATVARALGDMVAHIEKKGLVDAPVLRAMYFSICHMHSPGATIARRKLQHEGMLEKQVKGELNVKWLQGVLFELTVNEWLGGGSLITGEVKVLAKAFGLDLKALEKEVRADLGKKSKMAAAEELFAAGNKAASKEVRP